MTNSRHTIGPVSQSRDERLSVANEIVRRLRGYYGERVKAIGLFGSVAREADGPYSDVGLYCVVTGEGIFETVEWMSGRWKALVNIYSEDAILRDAAVVDQTWPLVQSGYVFTQALYDPAGLFERVRAVAIDSAKSDFGPWMRHLISEIFEIVGKARNARTRQSSSLPALSVEIVKTSACLIALDHRHMFVNSTDFPEESLALADRPEGYDRLCAKVLSGDLGDAATLADEIDLLWNGVESWARARNIRIYEAFPSRLPV